MLEKPGPVPGFPYPQETLTDKYPQMNEGITKLAEDIVKHGVSDLMKSSMAPYIESENLSPEQMRTLMLATCDAVYLRGRNEIVRWLDGKYGKPEISTLVPGGASSASESFKNSP